jgi:hypothetical protein
MDNSKQQQVQPAQPVQPVQPASPVRQPISVGRAKEMPAVPTEWVSPSTPEVVLPSEVKETGVEVKPVMPAVLPSAQQAGVTHAKEATPVPSIKVEPLGMKTPRSVLTQLKNAHKKVSDGFSWLVRLVIKEQDKEEKGASL